MDLFSKQMATMDQSEAWKPCNVV